MTITIVSVNLTTLNKYTRKRFTDNVRSHFRNLLYITSHKFNKTDIVWLLYKKQKLIYICCWCLYLNIYLDLMQMFYHIK